MELITDKIHHFQNFYSWALTRADDRVKDWLLMQSYTPTLAITAFYLFVVWIGPKLMKNKEPFKFKWTLFFYNFGLIVMNFHICSQLIWYATKLNYSYSCQPVDYSDNPDELNIAKALWWFYFSKCVEMLDTVFFILRKKDNQVSFLHVYHHATMFPIWWIGIKWVAGGQSFFGAMINSFIHVVMYTYYGVSALGPEWQKYLWWKRYLTKLQLLQFFIGMVYGVQGLLIECKFPKWMQYAGLVYGITIISLFINFYVHAYLKRKPSAVTKIQFVTGIVHAVQSLFRSCDFPEELHWALIFYAFTILSLFLNFYVQTYLKGGKKGDKSRQAANGKLANGGHKRNGSVVTANGVAEAKKDK